MKYITTKKYFLTALLVLLLTQLVYSQNKKESCFLLTANLGGNYFLPRDGFNTIPVKFTFNAQYIEFGYKFNNYNEIGFSIGKSDVGLKDIRFFGLNYAGTNGTDTIWQKYIKSSQINWIGGYYKFHLKNYFHAGIKIADVAGNHGYYEFSLGKDIAIEDKLFLRIGINYSFDSDNSSQFGSTIGIGFFF
jgi:hypothetical protein